jgi:hypothetical protein
MRPTPRRFSKNLNDLAGGFTGSSDQFFLQSTDSMETPTEGLIVLDGLEKVQEDGTRGRFGQLSAPNLRDFVQRPPTATSPASACSLPPAFPWRICRKTGPTFLNPSPLKKLTCPQGLACCGSGGCGAMTWSWSALSRNAAATPSPWIWPGATLPSTATATPPRPSPWAPPRNWRPKPNKNPTPLNGPF